MSDLPAPVARNLINHLALSSESCDISPRRLSTLSDTFDQKISRALRALGYYQSSWEKQITREQDCWSLVLDLELGTPATISAVDIELAGDISESQIFSDLVASSNLKIGTQINHAAYERFKTSLQSRALSLGYADSRFSEQQLLVDAVNNTAEIKLTFEGGARYHFGEVTFSNLKFDQSFLEKYQPFAAGDPFSSELLGEFQQRLVNSRLFAEVSIVELESNAAETAVPIQVTLLEVPRFVTSVGLGIATDTGPRASLSHENNRVNRIGHQYQMNTELSEIESSFDFSYLIPLAEPSTQQAKFSLGWIEENTSTSENEIWFAGASRTTETDRGWLRTLDLTYQIESYAVGADIDKTSLLIPGINWNRSNSNNLAYPTSGIRLQGGIRGTTEGLISDLSFLQLTGSIKYIHGLGSGRLLTRFRAGATLVDETSTLPASLRYFAGGDNSVRGFDYKSLGPTDSDGEVQGGKHLLTASIEYEHPIAEKYGLAVFYDMGNAFDDDQFTLEKSVGFGARWRSPIGPIRIDFGFPIDSEESFRLHLSMGPDL